MVKKIVVSALTCGLLMTAVASEDQDENRIGGSGCLEIGITSMNLDPLKRVVKNDLDKGGFDFSKNKFFTIGALGYSGKKRNGMRIGWGGWAGYNSMYSNEWQGVADSSLFVDYGDSLVDSVIQLHTLFAHTGLIVERSFNLRNVNLYAGGMMGGGVLVAYAQPKLSGNAFKYVDDHDSEIEINDSSITIGDGALNGDKAAFAPLWAFDIHGGITYSLTTWMHLGVDASALFYYSSTGFGYRYGDLFTVNPGVRIRLVFGTSA